MTREERNAHRRLLDLNPFHNALTRRVARRWRRRNADRINAARRRRYAEDPVYRAREQERQRKWREEHRESRRKSWAKWASAHRDHLRARDAARKLKPGYDAEQRRKIDLRRERRRTDPAYAAHIRAQKRAWYNRTKHTEAGLRWYMKYLWLPKWREVLAEGPERIRLYLKRCRQRTRHYFLQWYSRQSGWIDRTGRRGTLPPNGLAVDASPTELNDEGNNDEGRSAT